MLDAVVETIKKSTGANVEHAALIANSKILTLFSRFVTLLSIFHSRSLQVRISAFLHYGAMHYSALHGIAILCACLSVCLSVCL